MSGSRIPDWRDEAAYLRLISIDRAGLMWEWLRREEDYIAWHTRASRATKGIAEPAADGALQWGLHFRRRPGPGSPGRPDHLACRSRSRSAWRHCGAGNRCIRPGCDRRSAPCTLAIGGCGRDGNRAPGLVRRMAADSARYRERELTDGSSGRAAVCSFRACECRTEVVADPAACRTGPPSPFPEDATDARSLDRAAPPGNARARRPRCRRQSERNRRDALRPLSSNQRTCGFVALACPAAGSGGAAPRRWWMARADATSSIETGFEPDV